MAKFRDSAPESNAQVELLDAGTPRAASVPPPLHSAPQSEGDADSGSRSIGHIIAGLRNLSAEQVERILAHQKKHEIRFGEAAVALGFASKDDVLFALAQQFHYPYAPQDRREGSPELVALNEPFSTQAECFRALRSQLMMRAFREAGPHHAVAVISANRGDGKTYCAANLAVVLAQLGGRTLLVDADMRSPRQHEVFGIANHSGLSSILSGRADKQVIQQVALLPGLFVLPVGTVPPNPLELVERPAFGMLMRELTSKFDHVIVDTPAAVHGSDAPAIAARCGSALLIARQHTSRVVDLQELAGSLVGSHAKLVGAVVNER
jgi:protein-tyrosine kinase